MEEKGKQEMEETLRSIYRDISEESEEQERGSKDYVAEQAPRRNIKKETKGLQITLMMQDRKMDQLIQLLKDNGIVKAEPDTRTDDAMKP